MATLEINGRRVQVDDSFRSMSPEQQQAVVDEIAASIGPARTGAEEMRARGLSSSDPSEANAAAKQSIEREQAAAHVRENPVSSRVHSFNQGLPFVGEYYDEALGAIGGDDARERVRAGQNALRIAHPGQHAALNIAGGVTGSVAMLPAALAAPVPAAATTAGKVATGIGIGVLGGGSEGLVSGYGAGNGGDRMQSAMDRGKVGAALGAVVGGAAPMAAAGIRNLASRLKSSDVGVIAKELGVSKDAARVIRDALAADDLASGAQRIRGAGPDAMIADAGPGTAMLTDAVTSSPGPGQRIVRDAVDDRAAAAGGRLTGALDASMGPARGRGEIAEGIRKATAGARSQAYGDAYKTAIDYSSPAGRRIEDVLSRAPADTVQRAVKKANERMAYDGMQGQVMATIGKDGKVAFEKMPSAVELDYIKRGFDEIVEAGKDSVTGKLSPDAQFAAKIARDVKLAHAGANPAYRKALSVAGDSIQMENAVEAGYTALRPQTTRESLARSLRGASVPQRQAARQGMRSYIDDQMANARTVLSDPGRTGEIAEAIKGINEISSGSARQKLRIIMGHDADALLKEVDEVRTAFQLRAAIAQNSKTAPRQAIGAAIRDVTEPGAVGILMQGKPVEASKRVVQVLTGATKDMQQLRAQGIYEEIGRALTEKRGPLAERALQVIDRAIQGQPVSDAQALLVARALSATAAGAGYQTGTQLLDR